MLLWAKALPRRFRLHDTRHTTATLLLAAGVDLYAVARILRHTDPKVTFETYAHLVPGYLREQIDRLSALVPQRDTNISVPATNGTEVGEGARVPISVPSVPCPVSAKLKKVLSSSNPPESDATPVPRKLLK